MREGTRLRRRVEAGVMHLLVERDQELIARIKALLTADGDRLR